MKFEYRKGKAKNTLTIFSQTSNIHTHTQTNTQTKDADSEKETKNGAAPIAYQVSMKFYFLSFTKMAAVSKTL